MKNKKVPAIVACYLAIIVFTLGLIIVFGKSYTVYQSVPFDSCEISVEYSNDGIIENTSTKVKDGYVIVSFKALKKGTTTAKITLYNSENKKNKTVINGQCTVLPTGVLYWAGYEYGGYQFVLLGMCLIMFYSFLICLIKYKKRTKTQFFSYKTILDLALAVFFGLQVIMYLGLFGGISLFPHIFDGWRVYNLAGLIMMYIFVLSIPFLILFAGFLSLSNLSLIRHEGFGRNNAFGLLISLALFIGSIMCIVTAIRNPNSTGIELSEIRDAVIRTIVSSAFVYFECILFAAMYCTQYAAMFEPNYNQDFIIILGCKIRKDGTPLPLLKGRIDRAITFYKKQLEETGKQACFIPSGGKGSDEVISEAESMKNYLIEQGIDESIIYPETSSKTTYENMKYSKVIADEHKKNSNILFSTTNYHVFRSGMYSAKAGMNADGIGAKTKWYFWPNAQIREFIGLLASEWKMNIFFITVIVLLSTMFGNIPAIVNWIVK